MAGTGRSADHNYNWWDAIHSGGGSCGPSRQEPCDDNGHGSHTTGTSIGDDGSGNQIGVAPGAKWIGCRNMDQGVGTPATYTECFEFFIAPWDLDHQNPNPALRPHVVNNSWQCRPSQGCAPDTLRTVVENAQAAGIFVEASVDGGGPNCSTIANPPAIYTAAFSTGAVYNADFLAPFSGRGPVTIDGSGRIKPDIVAPGVNVRSSVSTSDSAYSFFAGTSMAGPHVVGVVALLWSARPELVRDIAATKALLGTTASPIATVTNGTQCGGIDHVPNNHFGWGLVDALAAVIAGGRSPRRHLHLHLRLRLRRHLRLRLLLRLPATTASASSTSATTAAAAKRALPRATGGRHEARPREADDPESSVRSGAHSTRSFPTTRAGHRPEPAAGSPPEKRLPRQPGRRPREARLIDLGVCLPDSIHRRIVRTLRHERRC